MEKECKWCLDKIKDEELRYAHPDNERNLLCKECWFLFWNMTGMTLVKQINLWKLRERALLNYKRI